MKLTFISDTHYQHRKLQLTSGDVLIHCGDFTRRGGLDDVESFAQFIGEQNFKTKIVIAGNHDLSFEDRRRREKAEKHLTDHGITYLNDTGVVIDGVKFWGSPVQPEFFGWAFNRKRGEELRDHWELIPEDTDVLITHGPAYGILDLCSDGRRVGCQDLLETVNIIKPKIHAFGHIHEDYGVVKKQGTIFVNACNVDEHYRMKNPPIVIDI